LKYWKNNKHYDGEALISLTMRCTAFWCFVEWD